MSIDGNGFVVGLLPPILRAFFVVVDVDGIFFGFAAFFFLSLELAAAFFEGGVCVKQAWSFPTVVMHIDWAGSAFLY